MNVKVEDLMTKSVVTTQPHVTVAHARTLLERNKISALPVVDSDGHPVGIISAADLIPQQKAESPVSKVMTEKVYSVPQYDEVSVAARIMRNHRIHRVVVTHEQRVVGMLSSFDLLKLVEDHRYVPKNPPTPKKRGVQRT